MGMNLEREKRMVLLTSILDLNGKGTKKRVLDNIEKKQFYKINHDDQQTMVSRDEEVWRNDLAFIRHHLVSEKYLDGSKRDNWEITQKGRIYFQSLLKEVLVCRNFEKLTNVAIDRAKELREKM
jgi:hypothetical protein